MYELVHSEDREELMQHLRWNSRFQQNCHAHSYQNGRSGAAAAITMSDEAILNDPNGNTIGATMTISSAAAAAPTADNKTRTNNNAHQQQQHHKSPSQMSLQEILDSSEYPPQLDYEH